MEHRHLSFQQRFQFSIDFPDGALPDDPFDTDSAAGRARARAVRQAIELAVGLGSDDDASDYAHLIVPDARRALQGTGSNTVSVHADIIVGLADAESTGFAARVDAHTLAERLRTYLQTYDIAVSGALSALSVRDLDVQTETMQSVAWVSDGDSQ